MNFFLCFDKNHSLLNFVQAFSVHPVCSDCDLTGERLGLCGNCSEIENVIWHTSSGRLKISYTKCRVFIQLKLS